MLGVYFHKHYMKKIYLSGETELVPTGISMIQFTRIYYNDGKTKDIVLVFDIKEIKKTKTNAKMHNCL